MSTVGLRREFARASAGGAAAARGNHARRSPTTARCHRVREPPPAAASRALQAAAPLPTPTLRANTNLINLGGGVPILGGAADGEGEGEEGAAVADAAISRAETDGFEKPASRAAAARWRVSAPFALRCCVRRRCSCRRGGAVSSGARTAPPRCIVGCRGATRAARSAWLRWPVR